MPVAILGDGDFLMGARRSGPRRTTGVPLLSIVCNNRSFYNDEVHQERVAKDARPSGREPLDRPAHRRPRARPRHARACAGLARHRTGHERRRRSHRRSRAVDAACNGKAVVVDVHVEPGYNPADGRGNRRARTARFRWRRSGIREYSPQATNRARRCRSRRRAAGAARSLLRRTVARAAAGGYVDDDQPGATARPIGESRMPGARMPSAASPPRTRIQGVAPRSAARARRALKECGRGPSRERRRARDARRGEHRQPGRADGARREDGGAGIDFFAGLVTELKGDTIPMGAALFNYTLREPLGVVARIVAYNHPLMFAAMKIGAPLAAGNTLVVKPPEQAPLSALRMAELIGGVFPPGSSTCWAAEGVRRGAGDASAGAQGHADRQRADRQGDHARGRRHAQEGVARARRQERADHVSRCRLDKATRAPYAA